MATVAQHATNQGLITPKTEFNVGTFEGKVSWSDTFRMAAGVDNSFLREVNNRIFQLNAAITEKTGEKSNSMIALYNRRVEILDCINEVKALRKKYNDFAATRKPNILIRILAAVRFLFTKSTTLTPTNADLSDLHAKIGEVEVSGTMREIRGYKDRITIDNEEVLTFRTTFENGNTVKDDRAKLDDCRLRISVVATGAFRNVASDIKQELENINCSKEYTGERRFTVETGRVPVFSYA